MTTRPTLHDDAAVASITWAKLLPTSFTGSIICPTTPHINRSVMSRSLALIHSVEVQAFELGWFYA